MDAHMSNYWPLSLAINTYTQIGVNSKTDDNINMKLYMI